ncbi:MAG: Serine/threonine-protein kinase pkn3 [Myxococcaceae bacterium]|nr:Serine/threonine-protein kinase pkn3 [Myxococcaceae bacterium]MEA2752177.1 eukaryotic-like serine/threonine-protein kinase [Myxococcales bacterium]
MEETRIRPGDLLGSKYRVERVLGRGGMGVVMAATHLDLDQRVAIKLMLPGSFGDPDTRARFQREARSAVKLRSEHVGRVLDTGTFDDGSPYIVMEYLEGNDLAAELARTGPLAVHLVAEYILQACDAIAEAHALGIVHRDLKPANIFLTRRHDGSPLVKVLDFGISKVTALDAGGLGMTATASMLGSPLYMSPEQMRSSRDVDARTDVWSLGIILYELLSGRVPFAAETLGDLLARVIVDQQRPLISMRADVPPDISQLVDYCLIKDRAHRAPSVAEIARVLGRHVPTRAVALVERIINVLGARNDVPAPPPHVVSQLPAPPPAVAATSPAWSATAHQRRSPRNAIVAFVGIGAVVGGLAAGAWAWRSRAGVVATPSSTPASIAPPPPSAAPLPSAAPPPSAVPAAIPAVTANAIVQSVRPDPEPTPPPAIARTATAPKVPAPAAPQPRASASGGKPAAVASTRVAPTTSAKKPGIMDTSE